MNDTHIAAYISDHLSDLDAVLELLECLTQKENSIEHHRFFQRIQLEIVEDQKTLKKLLDELREKEEEVRRLRGSSDDRGAGNLSRKMEMNPGTLGFFEALELLVLRIQGTSLLWRVLAMVASRIPAWRGTDFKGLEKRAKNQRDRVESVRMDVASALLLGH